MSGLVKVRHHQYQVDPETGYLQDTASNGVTVQQKKLLIEMLEENPHGTAVTTACEKVGISQSSFFRHIAADPAFRASWERLKELYGYRVEAVNAHLALEPKYVIDRMAYLRAFRRERYAPETRFMAPPSSETPDDWKNDAAKVIDVSPISSNSVSSPTTHDSSGELPPSEKKGGDGGKEGDGVSQK